LFEGNEPLFRGLDIYGRWDGSVNDFGGIESLVRSFFSSIPYEWHTKNEIAHYEDLPRQRVLLHFAAAGLAVVVVEIADGSG